MPDDRLLLVFKFPNDAGKYFYRSEDINIVNGQRIKRPVFSLIQREAHRFHPESAVAFRDFYAALFQKDGVLVSIETNRGEVKFAREVTPQTEPDTRQISWYSPDDLEDQCLGFIVRPGVRPDGPCWFVKAGDHPSLEGRVLESAFGKTPGEAVERCRQLWGSLVVPIPSPNQEARDDAELRTAIEGLKNVKYGSGRRRPGDF